LEQVGEAVLQTALEKWQKENPRTYNSYKKASEKEAEQEYYPFLTSISYDLACRFHLHKEQYPGIRIQASSRRVYEDSTCAPHLMGRLGLMNKEEYEEKRFQGYIATDRLGKTGIERYYENQLKGKRGLKLIEFDKNTLKNNIIFEDQDPVKNEVQLTLDFPLQKFTETVLDSYPGKDGKGPRLLACVLLRAEDGQVLAMATTPRYDLERFGKDYPQLKDDPRHPLLNRCIQNFIVPNPGSVFKLVTAMALLEEGIATPDHTADCQGYLFNPRSFRCHIWEYRRGHGTVDLPHALEQSCNIYFYRYGELLGIEKLAYWSKKCGFGQKTGIEGDGEQAGLVPTPEWLQGNTFIPPEERSWTTGLTRLCAIGQKIEVTPLQVARFFCALGNGGYLVQPHLVHDPEKNYRESEPLCSSNTMKELLKGMELVTYGERGTGNRYGLQAFGFIGKTGTADTSKGEEPHAWLAGFAPKERPEVTLVLMAEKAGHGGEVCGPLAQKILDFYFKKLKNRIPEEF
jgi:penicillin-binding protein 2